jgi:hypothetical protein
MMMMRVEDEQLAADSSLRSNLLSFTTSKIMVLH